MLFKTVNIRQKRAMIPERQESNKISFRIARSSCLEFPHHGTRRRKPGRSQCILWIEETELRIWKAQCNWSVQDRIWREESCTENSREPKRVSVEYSAEHATSWAFEETEAREGSIWQDRRGKCLSHRTRNSDYSQLLDQSASLCVDR